MEGMVVCPDFQILLPAKIGLRKATEMTRTIPENPGSGCKHASPFLGQVKDAAQYHFLLRRKGAGPGKSRC